MPQFNHSIIALWPDRPESEAEIGDKLVRTLDALGQIDPAFREWGLRWSKPLGLIPLEALRDHMAAYIGTTHTRDWKDRRARGYGYHPMALNLLRCGEEVEPGRRINLDVCAGATRDNLNRLALGPHFGPPFAPEITAYPVFKAMLLLVAEIWPSDWVGAAAYPRWPPAKIIVDGVETIPPPTRPYSRFGMPWMTYLSPENAERVRPPAEILTQPVADGGVLLIACEETLDPNNSDHLRRSDLLLSCLLETIGEPPVPGARAEPARRKAPRGKARGKPWRGPAD
jgi:hypothetical protein